MKEVHASSEVGAITQGIDGLLLQELTVSGPQRIGPVVSYQRGEHFTDRVGGEVIAPATISLQEHALL